MFIINDRTFIVVLMNFGVPLSKMPFKKIIEIGDEVAKAELTGKDIVFIEDDFGPDDGLFFVRGTIDLTNHQEQLNDLGGTGWQTQNNQSKQVLGFSKEVLGLGRSSAPRGNG